MQSALVRIVENTELYQEQRPTDSVAVTLDLERAVVAVDNRPVLYI